MARLIDADALVAKLKMQYGDDLGWQCTVNMSDVGMMVEDAPTVDAVEVVRCKDCKYYVANYCVRDIKGRTNMFYMPDDAFCSYGERKVSEDAI